MNSNSKDSKKPKILGSPKENTAEDEVSLVSTAEIEIKRAIVQAVRSNASREDISKVINSIIVKYVSKLPANLQTSVKKSLFNSANRWWLVEGKHLKLMHESFIRRMEEIDPSMANYVRNEWKKVEKIGRTSTSISINIDKSVEPTSTFDRFRGKLVDSPKGLALVEDYEKKVRNELKVLASNPPISTEVTKEGKPYRLSLRNLAEMKIRYNENQKQVAEFEKEGIDLFWFSSHADCSERCSHYQGQLASRNPEKIGKIIEGNRVIDAEEAFDGPLKNGNGIINGYNCRHHIIEWFPGSKAPKFYADEEIKKEQAIDQKQRYFENNIRLLKKEEILHRALGNKDYADKLNYRWHQWDKNYKKFSFNNHRAIYPWRTRVHVGEKEFYKELGLKEEMKNAKIDMAEAKSQIDKANTIEAKQLVLQENIQNGKISIEIEEGKQWKHIETRSNYIEGKSILTANPNELAKFAGTGEIRLTGEGKWSRKEVVDFGYEIGIYKDTKGNSRNTTQGTIHYSNKGIHIIPSYPKKGGKK